MAEPYYVAVSPHNYNSITVGLASSIQVSACISNFLIMEYFVNFEETGREIMKNPFKVNESCIKLPDGPGLGVELREEELLARESHEQPKRALRNYHEEWP